ncbi:MarR family transcriptional regulator [Acidothermaceae bacterium B102]|nr:MarR family transcriptional regulator [Acidothermaceae bacterium B102]
MPPAASVDETAAQLRLAVGQLVRRLRAETVAQGGLPVAQAAVLGWLDREGPMTTAELAAVQSVRHQSTARVVGQLVDQSMVTLAAHPEDGRKVVVSLAPSGRRALQHQRAERVGWLADAISDRLTVAEQRVLAEAAPLLLRLVEG